MSEVRKTRVFKIIAIVFAIVIVLPVLILVGVLQYLKTNSGAQFVFEKMRTELRDKYQVQIETESAGIDALNGIHLKGLHIVINQKALQADLRSDSFDLVYDFSILGRSLSISQFRIGATTGHIHTVSSGPAAPVEDSKEEKTTGKKTDMNAMLRHPPVKVSVKNFEIAKMDLDFSSDTEEMSVHGLHLKTDFNLTPGKMATTGEFALAKTSIAMRSQGQKTDSSEGPGTQSSLALEVASEWSANIEEKDHYWIYDLHLPKAEIEITKYKSESKTFAPPTSMTLDIPRILVTSSLRLLAHTKEAMTPEKNALETVDAEAKVLFPASMKVVQVGGGVTAETTIEKQELKFDSKLRESLKSEFFWKASRIVSPNYATSPFDVLAQGRLDVPRDLQTAVVDGDLNLNAIELAKYNLKIDLPQDEKADTHVKGQAQIKADPKLANFLKSAAQLKKTGVVNINSDFDFRKSPEGAVQLDGKFAFENAAYGSWEIKNQLAAKTKKPGDWTGQGSAQIDEKKKPKPGVLPLELVQAVSLNYKFAIEGLKKTFNLELAAPETQMTGLARMHTTQLKMSAAQNGAASDLDLALSQGRIDLVQSAKAPMPLRSIDGIDMTLVAHVAANQLFNLEKFEFNVNHTLLKFTAHGTGDIKAKDAHIETSTEVLVPKDFPEIAGQTLQGKISMPIVLTVLGGREITVDGYMNPQDLKWRKGDMGFDGMTGIVPIDEKITIEQKPAMQVKFKTLITQNPFERVDFERVRPLLQSAELMRIEHINWFEKSYGPLTGFFSVRQNMISAHQFDLDLVNGRMNGEMFFDVYPSNLEFGILARMTGLDLGEILPQKFLSRMGAGEKRVSGRTGVVFNLNKSSVDGRIDVTEIGGPALVALINVLDPVYQDEKMNQMRSVLTYGYPTSVALSFNEGYMDMDVGLLLLGIPKNQSIRGIPVTGLISSASAEIVKQTQKGPLK